MSNRVAEILKGSFVTRTSGFLDVSAKAGLFKEISAILGGDFNMSHNPGNVLSTLRIVIPYKNREIILTESDTRPLKFQVSFEPLLDYDFIIGIEDNFDKILKHNVYTVSYQTDNKQKKSELMSVVSRTLEDKEAYLDLVSLHQIPIDNLTESGTVSSER